jgi:hypothetical protein
MDAETKHTIAQRIAELETERNQLAQMLTRQANVQLAPYNAAITELKRLIEPKEAENAGPG